MVYNNKGVGCLNMKVVLVLQLVIGMGYSFLIDMKQLSGEQVEVIVKLKELVEKEELKVEPRMTENYNLAKWLQAHDFNVDATLKAIQKNVQWRAEEKIDKILEEDWTEMRKRFSYSRDTVDKEGRQIQYIDVEKWEIATYLSLGDNAYNHFLRYMIMWAEESETLVQEQRKAGKDVTQGTMIVNLASFALLEHACISCLQVYRDANLIVGNHYPNFRNKATLVNAPLYFQTVYFVLTPEAHSQMVIFGQDRSQWEPALLENIAPDQIPMGLLVNAEPLKKDNAEGIMKFKKEL